MANVDSAINQLNGAVNSFSSNVSAHVQNVDTVTRNIQQTAESVYQKVNQFRSNIMRGEEKQIAHENIMRIDQIVKEQFGNYDAIRKTIIGVVRDFDINLVRNSTIEELSEELWITSSRYWLSYALLAVTAWVNNYPEVARNALSESSRRDAIKTSLFFCLLNLRFERITTAREWFKVYCKTLDPTMLQQETAVMIQAFMNGIFGRDKQLEYDVTSIINDWIRIISEDAAICESLVNDYINYFEKFNMQAQFNYEFISKFCTNSDAVRASFIDASKYDKLIALVESMSVEDVVRNDENYKNRVDAVLNNLITNYDAEELEIKNEQQYFRLIVENDGDKETAQQQYEEIKRRQGESYNIGKQMVEWVIDQNGDVDTHVRKFGLQSTKEWFTAALEKWTARVKERCPLQYSFAIDEWQSISNGRDLDEQRVNLQNFFENNKFRMTYVNTLNIAFAVLFFVALIITVSSIVSCVRNGFNAALIVGLLLMIISAGVVAYRVINGQKLFKERVNEAVFNLENTFVQIVEFQRYFSENIRKKNDILAKINYI